MIVKLIGGALLVLSGVIGAEALNTRAAIALERVDGWIALLRYARRMVECYALPEAVMLSRADGAMLAACGYRRDTPPKSFRAMLSASAEGDLSENARAVLQSFVSSFGQGYRDEQMRICDDTVLALNAEREALASALPARRQKNTTFAVAGAIGLAIILL